MKFRIMSDLHLEFDKSDEELFPVPYMGEDFLILAGDIQAGTKKQKWFKRLLKDRSVIYIAGNHEFYGQDYHYQKQRMHKMRRVHAQEGGKVNTLHMLDNSSIAVGDNIQVLGTTLWSDIDPSFYMDILRGMNDYHAISYTGGKLTPRNTTDFFRSNVEWLEKEISIHKQAGKKVVVVVTHHAPSYWSVSEKFAGDRFNSAYASSLERLVKQVDLWVHGHMHDSFDYMIGNCRVVCNPRGYRDQNKEFDINKMVEL